MVITHYCLLKGGWRGPLGNWPGRTDTENLGQERSFCLYPHVIGLLCVIMHQSCWCRSERYNLPFVSSCQMSVAEGEFPEHSFDFHGFQLFLLQTLSVHTVRSSLSCLKVTYLQIIWPIVDTKVMWHIQTFTMRWNRTWGCAFRAPRGPQRSFGRWETVPRAGMN